MNLSYFRAIAILAMFAAAPVNAQDKTADKPAAEKPGKRIDCANRHDHAAERSASGLKAACANKDKGSKKIAKRPLHDHNKR